MPAENLHVTIRFLGEVATDDAPGIIAAVDSACAEARPFELAPAALRARPGLRRASLVWLDYVDVSGGAEALARAIDDRLTVLGIDPEPRPFRAHVTLVRARRSRDATSLLNASDQRFVAPKLIVSDPSVSVFSSRLTPHGPIYEELTTCHLRGE